MYINYKIKDGIKYTMVVTSVRKGSYVIEKTGSKTGDTPDGKLLPLNVAAGQHCAGI